LNNDLLKINNIIIENNRINWHKQTGETLDMICHCNNLTSQR